MLDRIKIILDYIDNRNEEEYWEMDGTERNYAIIDTLTMKLAEFEPCVGPGNNFYILQEKARLTQLGGKIRALLDRSGDQALEKSRQLDILFFI